MREVGGEKEKEKEMDFCGAKGVDIHFGYNYGILLYYV